MTPSEIFTTLTGMNREAALIVFAGLGVFAAVTTVLAWGIDEQTSIRFGVYILGFGATVVVLSYVITHPVMQKVVGWFIIVFGMAASTTFFLSVITTGIVPPPWCLVEFWKQCEQSTDDAAARHPVPPVAAPADLPAAAPDVDPGEYRVSVKFAGLVQRDNVRSVMRSLEEDGWRIENTAGGGERTADAAGFNEVRYGAPEDEGAARVLAYAMQKANLTGAEITIRLVGTVESKTLEVWVSRT